MILGAFLGLSVASCADQNFDWEEARNQNPEYTFRSNFEKLVGEIDPNQSWDFSRGAKKSGTRAMTRGSIVPTENGWYNIDQNTIKYLIDNLPEGINNKTKGKSFTLSAPSNGFAVIPLYQGGAAYFWELHMVAINSDGSTTDETLWHKHKDLECQLTADQVRYDTEKNIEGQKDNSQTGDVYMKVRNTTDWYKPQQSFKWNIKNNEDGTDASSWQNEEVGYNTMGASQVRTKPIIPTTPLAPGQSLYFYLKVWTSASDWKDKSSNHDASSMDNMMGYLINCPAPENLLQTDNGETKEVMIIGCEDNPNGDWDLNDFAFMIVGYPNVPIPHDITENIEIRNSKRYMVEDLGSTSESDIDFNDIVIDLEEYRTVTITTSETGVKNITYGETKQRAKVWAMGGTLDFYFLIKNTTDGTYNNIYHKAAWKDYKKMLNTDAATLSYSTPISEYFDITGWDPASNNVAFLVCRDRNLSLDDYFSTTEHTDGIQTNNWISLDSMVPLNVKTDTSGGHLVSGDGKLDLINFPQTGTTPFIVAFDTDKEWRDERHAVCSHWLYGSKKDDGKACATCGEKDN